MQVKTAQNTSAFSLAFSDSQALHPLEGLSAVLASSDYGVLLTDLNHKSLLCNQRFGELFEIDLERVVAHDVEAVREMVRHRIANVEAWEANLDKVYNDPEVVQEDELHLMNPQRVLRRYSGPVLDREGAAVGRLWTFLDMTRSWRRRQLDILSSEALGIFKDDPLEVCHAILDLIAAHYGAIALLSLKEGEYMRFAATGGMPAEYRHVEGNGLDESFCQYCLRDNKPIVVQDARENPAYSGLLPVRLGLHRYAGVPLTSSSGELIGSLCILDNHTEVSVGQDDIRLLTTLGVRISAELERYGKLESLRKGLREAETELHLAQSELIQNEKLALAGTLSASIAHDIRNIMASMSLQISMAEENPARAVAFIRDSLARFDVLAHRLLSYAKPSRAAVQLLEFTKLANGVVDLVRPQFMMSGVALHFENDGKPIYVEGDPARLEHLLVNLTTNALQAPRGKGVVAFRLFAEAGCAVAQIEDNGPGIPHSMRANLFEPFTSSRRDGFGLGLYSCKQIAQSHGASLEFECPEQGGTCFTFKIPISR